MHGKTKFGDREYSLTLASEIDSDSMLLELDDVTNGTRTLVAYVRHADADGSMTFSGSEREVPLAAVEHLIAAAHQRLPRRADGDSR